MPQPAQRCGHRLGLDQHVPRRPPRSSRGDGVVEDQRLFMAAVLTRGWTRRRNGSPPNGRSVDQLGVGDAQGGAEHGQVGVFGVQAGQRVDFEELRPPAASQRRSTRPPSRQPSARQDASATASACAHLVVLVGQHQPVLDQLLALLLVDVGVDARLGARPAARSPAFPALGLRAGSHDPDGELPARQVFLDQDRLVVQRQTAGSMPVAARRSSTLEAGVTPCPSLRRPA